MNKQEAKQKLHNIAFAKMNARPDDLKLADVMQVIDQIDQPHKVVVPAFIDSYIRYAKAEGMSLFIAMDNAQNKELDWIITNEETFARAWLDGYQIEQEKLYTVEIPNNGGTLVLAYINNAMKLVDSNKHLPGKFTKESIEYAGFGWVFDCKGVKVVEVEVLNDNE